MVLFPPDQLGLQIPDGALHGPRSQGLTKAVQLLFGAEKTLQDHKRSVVHTLECAVEILPPNKPFFPERQEAENLDPGKRSVVLAPGLSLGFQTPGCKSPSQSLGERGGGLGGHRGEWCQKTYNGRIKFFKASRIVRTKHRGTQPS